MEKVGAYIIIFLLSIVAIATSVYMAAIEGNITHMKNGRKPNAGVSLVGYIIYPIFFMGIAYIGNLVYYGLGWYISFGLFFIAFLYAAATIPKKIKQYNYLLGKQNENS